MVKRLLLTLALLLVPALAAAQDQTIGGTLGVNGATVTLPIDGRGSGAIQIDTSCTCTIQFEAIIQGTWFSLPAFPVGSTTAVTSATAAGRWIFGAAGYRQVRLRVSAYAAGTATVGIRVSPGSQVVTSTGGGGAGGAVTITDGAGDGPVNVEGTSLDVRCTSGCAAGTLGQQTMANSAPVVIASDQSTVVTSGTTNALTSTTGTIHNGTTENIELTVTGYTVATIALTSTTATSGTIVFEVQPSGGQWQSIYGTDPVGRPLALFSFLVGAPNTVWRFPVAGMAKIRVRAANPPNADSSWALFAMVGEAPQFSGAVLAADPGTGDYGLVVRNMPAFGSVQDVVVTTLPNEGQQVMANSISVAIASNQSAVPVSGTVTTSPPANASTNIAQMNGVTVTMGNGASGTGVQRVTLANDSTGIVALTTGSAQIGHLEANQSSNTAQFGGTNVSTGTGAGGAGIPRVTISNDSSLAANQSVNLAQVAGTTTVNGGLAGSLATGGTAGNNAAITQNPLVIGVEARSSTPTAATNGNQIRAAGDLAGNAFRVAPISWTCNLQALGATLTQCQAAPSAGYSLYVTSVIATTTTGTAGTFAIRYGTGSNCATTPIGVWPQPGGAAPSRVVTAPIVTAAPMVLNLGLVGLKLAAANAVCVIGVATNTIDIALSGYTAP